MPNSFSVFSPHLNEQWEWLTKIETKLEELMLLKESPEKKSDKTKELPDKTTKWPDDPIKTPS
jgi:hypothetical protein